LHIPKKWRFGVQLIASLIITPIGDAAIDAVIAWLPPQPIEPSIALNKTPDSKVIDHPPRNHRYFINFNEDPRLTDNSLAPLQHGGIGDDEGFDGCDGVLVLGIDRP
jgi:hypothetical protein